VFMPHLRGGLTTHSTGADTAQLSSARLDAWFGVSRPVNSGVMPLCIKTEAELNGSTKEIYGDS